MIEIDLADDHRADRAPARTTRTTSRCCPKSPATKIDEVFIGSCMTNIGHFRAAGKVLDGKSDIPTRLWIAPPTKMDAMILTEEGYYGVLGKAGARMEMPGCSLCMGNQAQIRKGSTAMSTSTRNFPNRLGIDTQRLPGLGRTGRHVRADWARSRPLPSTWRTSRSLTPRLPTSTAT